MPRYADIQIPMPVRGYVEGTAYSNQPDLTTRSAMNVVPHDPSEDRLRPGARDMLAKYFTDAVSGTSRIQELHGFTNVLSSFSVVPTDLLGSDDFTRSPDPSTLDDAGVTWDEYGRSATIVSATVVTMFNSGTVTEIFRSVSGLAQCVYAFGGAGTSNDDNVARSLVWRQDTFAPGSSRYTVKCKITTTASANSAERYTGGIIFRAYTSNGQHLRWFWEKKAGAATAYLRLMSVDGSGTETQIYESSSFTADANQHLMEVRVNNHNAQFYWDGQLKTSSDLTAQYGTALQHVAVAIGSMRTRASSTFADNNLTLKFDDWQVYEAEVPTSFREDRIIVASGGNVKVGTKDSGLATVSTGGSSALESGVNTVEAVFAINSATGGSNVYLVDGFNYKIYTPSTDTISDWTPTAGMLPNGNGAEGSLGAGTNDNNPRCRFISLYRGRVVLSGLADQPHNWFMSSVGDPLNWDYFANGPASAVAGNQSDAGEVPDVITSLIPYFDDAFIFGCAGSVWVMQGDITQEGTIRSLSRDVGLAGPRAWAHGPGKTVYAFLTDGLYRFSPNQFNISQSNRLSLGRLDKTFRSIDFSITTIQLAWDTRRHGLWVFVTPLAQGETTHYFWDQRTDSFWPVQFPEAHGPTSVYEFKADDPLQRAVLLGGFDSYVRHLTDDSTTDDGTDMESTLVLGPVRPPWADREARLSLLKATLDLESSGLDYAVAASGEAEGLVAASAAFSGSWAAGRNAAVYDRARGVFSEVRLTSDGRWSMEQITARLTEGGKARPR